MADVVGVVAIIFAFCLLLAVTYLAIQFLLEEIRDKEILGIGVGICCVMLILILIVVCVHDVAFNTHKCPNCGDFSFGDNYCRECGQQLVFDEELKCPQCGEENDCGSHYCCKCGASLEDSENG